MFKKSVIAASITAAITPAGLQAFDWNKDWNGNIELFAVPTSKSRNLMGGQLLQPLLQNNQSLTYFDFRGTFDLGETEEFNFGLGHRFYFRREWILGGYASFDTRETERDKRHNQVTLGVEALSVRFDAGFNYYLPLSDPKTVGLGTGGGTFIGTRLFANAVMEEALEGYDFEVGALLPFVPIGEARLYVGGYDFYGDVADMDFGAKARVEYRPRKDIMIGASVQHDDLFQTEAMLTVNYSFGMPKEGGVRTLSERMIQFHQRDIDVKETSQLPDRKMESGDVDDRITVSDDVVHIDNALGTAGGDGSIENPYNSFANCAKCGTLPGALIYVHAGNSVTGTAYDTVNINLLDNQKLIGQGFSLFGLGGDIFPEVTAGGNVINLANNNEVAGLEINDDLGATNGIYGSNITGFNIHNNRILGVGRNGIYINTHNSVTTGTIANNTIYNAGRNGIYLRNYAYNGNRSTQTVTLTDNNITYSGRDGVHLKNKVYGDGGFNNTYRTAATQTVILTGNTINRNSSSGVYGRNYIVQEETYAVLAATQTVTLTNNTINNNTGYGVSFENRAYGDSYAGQQLATQTLTLRDNTISGNSDDGVRLYNVGDSDGSSSGYGGIVTQTAVLSNNVITNNGNAGVLIFNDAGDNTDNDGITATQTVTLTDNILSGNYYGVYIRNESGDNTGGLATFSTQTVTLTGNTINNSTSDGIHIENYGGYDSNVYSTQTVILTDNTISGSGDDGIDIYNGVSGGNATQVVDLSGGGNTISNSASYGVQVNNYYSGGNLSQTVDLTGGNTLSGNTSGAVYVGYNNATAGANQTVTGP